MKSLRRLLLALATLMVCYFCAVLLLGLVPSHPDFRSRPDGVPVWLDSNGVHSGVILPIAAEGIDWRMEFPPQHTLSGRQLPGWDSIEFGWGSRSFFLNVPDWSDLRPGLALYALSGLDSGALHVEYLAHPAEGPQVRALRLSADAYRHLAAYIRASALRDATGRPRWIAGHRYGRNDAFYEAAGHYSLFFTCNQWTRDALASAGVRVPVWAPFDWALFWQLK